MQCTRFKFPLFLRKLSIYPFPRDIYEKHTQSKRYYIHIGLTASVTMYKQKSPSKRKIFKYIIILYRLGYWKDVITYLLKFSIFSFYLSYEQHNKSRLTQCIKKCVYVYVYINIVCKKKKKIVKSNHALKTKYWSFNASLKRITNTLHIIYTNTINIFNGLKRKKGKTLLKVDSNLIFICLHWKKEDIHKMKNCLIIYLFIAVKRRKKNCEQTTLDFSHFSMYFRYFFIFFLS